jgi:beta-glucosidase
MKFLRRVSYITLLTLLVGLYSCDNTKSSNSTHNASQKDVSKYDKQINELIAKMTLEEKIGQMNMLTSDWDVTGPVMRSGYKKEIKKGQVGSLLNAYTAEFTKELVQLSVDSTRLGIPILIGYDVIHGHRTIFPFPMAEACSWNLESIEKSARIAAIEASAEGIHWTFAPMVDISRDPRWGRVMEGAGEDTWLGSKIAGVRIKGFQGDDISKSNTILACTKHFAAYGAPEAGRDYGTVDMSKRVLMETYMPPYKATVDAGVKTFMTAFNELDGVPSTGNKWLWTDLLRNEWGWDGFIVTDYTAINELVPHGVAGDLYDAAVLAANAGIDIDMVGNAFIENLKKAVENGDVSESTIDAAVYQILKAKYELGLFENPYKYNDVTREKKEIMSPEKIAFARKSAAESMVLLKNSNQVLPFSKDVKTIAVIGPLADEKEDLIGAWSAAGDRVTRPVTLLEGVKNKVGKNVKVLFAKGTDVEGNSTKGFAEAIKMARKADVVLLAIGEKYWMTGEAASRSNIDIPGNQEELAEAIFKANKKTAVILMNGRPLTIENLDKTAPAILETWFAGTETGNAIADVVFGDYNPAGKLVMTFPRNVGQIPIYYNHKNTGRPLIPTEKYTTKYLDVPNTPLYPFGYGLSYTTFKYSNLKIDKQHISENETVNVSIDVTNTGDYAGEEVVQMYIRDLVGSVTRPVRELKGFEKIKLNIGETKTVKFSLGKEELSFYRLDMTYGTESGKFDVYIGESSDTKNKVSFTLK